MDLSRVSLRVILYSRLSDSGNESRDTTDQSDHRLSMRCKSVACFTCPDPVVVYAGYFPDHTLTEDYALGMEMRRTGWREVYVEDELVRGSAPDKVRGAFGQRSRWCKVTLPNIHKQKNQAFQ